MLTRHTLLRALAIVLFCAFLLTTALPLAEYLAQAQLSMDPMQPKSVQTSTDVTSSVTYTYDGLGRLVAVNYGNGKSVTYTYDSGGNLLGRTVTSGSRLMLPYVTK